MTDEFKTRELTERVQAAIDGIDRAALLVPAYPDTGLCDQLADVRAGLAAGLDEIEATA